MEGSRPPVKIENDANYRSETNMINLGASFNNPSNFNLS